MALPAITRDDPDWYVALVLIILGGGASSRGCSPRCAKSAACLLRRQPAPYRKPACW